MQSVVIDEPYEFVPPYFGRCWPWLLQRFARRRLRRSEGIEQLHCEGVDRLRESLAAGHSVLLAANHCRPSDPLVMVEMCRRAGVVPFTMASWHLFKQSPLQRFVLRRIGGFSVYREGLDRQALQASVDILQAATRPLVIFPEGVITRTNDRLVALMEGLAFIARSAAKKRAAADPPGQVVVHPVALRYNFHGDIDAALNETLDAIEHRLSWRPRRDSDRVQRIYRVGEALLWLKEIEYFGRPQTGDIPSRLQQLIDGILEPLEEEWLAGKTADTTVARVKQLRSVILQEMVAGGISPQERTRRWEQLEDMDLAQQLSHYPPEYVRSNPTTMRVLETVEKFEEDLTGVSRIHRPMSVTTQIGTAIPVSPKRTRGVAEDPLMTELERQLHEMLGIPLPATKQRVAAMGADAAAAEQPHDA
jgi:1-acyl-sn-glycerol-3-phosphate acyltransferase